MAQRIKKTTKQNPIQQHEEKDQLTDCDKSSPKVLWLLIKHIEWCFFQSHTKDVPIYTYVGNITWLYFGSSIMKCSASSSIHNSLKKMANCKAMGFEGQHGTPTWSVTQQRVRVKL